MKKVKQVPRTYRQGDVLLVEVAQIPVNAKAVRRVGGRVILAEGEVTGHRHAISDGGVELLELGERRYLNVPETGAELRHEEHTKIDVTPGAYEVVIQREFDDAEEWRRVAD